MCENPRKGGEKLGDVGDNRRRRNAVLSVAFNHVNQRAHGVSEKGVKNSPLAVIFCWCDNHRFGSDHVSMGGTDSPSLSISQVVNRLKQGTTIKLYDKCEPHLKKFYWKKKRTHYGLMVIFALLLGK